MSIQVINPPVTSGSIVAALGFTPAATALSSIPTGTVAAPGGAFTGATDYGLSLTGGNTINISVAGAAVSSFSAAGFALKTDGLISAPSLVVGTSGLGFYNFASTFSGGSGNSIGIGTVNTQAASRAGGSYGAGPISINAHGTLVIGHTDALIQPGEAININSGANSSGGRMLGIQVNQWNSFTGVAEPQLLPYRSRGAFNTLGVVLAGDEVAKIQAQADDGFGTPNVVVGNIEMNVDATPNAAFTASFATNVMTVTGSPTGTIKVGQIVQTAAGSALPAGTTISSLGTGTGGAGTYNLSATVGTIGSQSVNAYGVIPGNFTVRTTPSAAAGGSDLALVVDSSHLMTVYGNITARGGIIQATTISPASASVGSSALRAHNDFIPTGNFTTLNTVDLTGNNRSGTKVTYVSIFTKTGGTVAGSEGGTGYLRAMSAGVLTDIAAWDGDTGGMTIGAATGAFKGVGTLNAATAIYINGTKVIGARDTGFAAMTGTPDEGTTYDTASVTLPQLAGRVMALQAALTTHGLIGT